MKILNRLLKIFLILILAVRVVVYLKNIPPWEMDYPSLRSKWLHSQYNLNQGYEYFGMMGDEDLYKFAAMEYMMGKDPSVVCFEHPPLGKYFLGLSQVLFKNMMIAQIAASLGVLLVTYLLATGVGLPVVAGLLVAVLVSFEPLFMEFASFVNVDMMHTLFVLLGVLFLIRKKFDLFGLFFLGTSIGGVLSTKVFFNGSLLFIFTATVFFLRKEKKPWQKILIVAGWSLLIYLLSYAVYFFYHSPWDFVLFHIKLLRFFRSYLPEYPWFEIFRVLFLGRWRTWFSQPPIQPVAGYWPAWSLSGAVTLWLALQKKTWKIPWKAPAIYLGWVVFYLLYSSFHLVFPKYLLLVLPLMYILSIRLLVSLVRGNNARI